MNHLASARDGQPPRSSKPPRGNEAPRRTPRSENRGWFQAFLRTPKGTLTALFAVILAVAGTATGWPQAPRRASGPPQQRCRGGPRCPRAR